jgi:hypothetical protein
MANGDPRKMKTLVMEVNSKLHALLDLFGDKERTELDLEILYGITTPAEHAMAAHHLEMTSAMLSQATLTAKALAKSSKMAARETAVHN